MNSENALVFRYFAMLGWYFVGIGTNYGSHTKNHHIFRRNKVLASEKP